MTAKTHILGLIQNLPDDVCYAQIARDVELVAGNCEAQEQVARGEGFSAKDILKELPSWIEGQARS